LALVSVIGIINRDARGRRRPSRLSHKSQNADLYRTAEKIRGQSDFLNNCSRIHRTGDPPCSDGIGAGFIASMMLVKPCAKKCS